MISSEYFRLPRHSGGTKISDILTILSFPISLALYSIFPFTTAKTYLASVQTPTKNINFLKQFKARSVKRSMDTLPTLLELTTSRSFLGDFPPDPLLEAI